MGPGQTRRDRTNGNSGCTGGTSGTADNGDYYLQVDIPDCGYQLDFVFGNVIVKYVSGGPTYHSGDRWIDGSNQPNGDSGGCGGGSGSPSASPSTSPSTSPSGGVQGITSSASPTATPTGSVQGISTPSTGAGAGSSLGVDLAAFALLFLGFISVGLARRQPVELS